MSKKFFQQVLPAMLAFVFSSLYAIVDGFFVGRSVGDTGLAAINIAYPLTALIQAAGTGLGMGGAVQMAICRGRGDKEAGNRFLGATLTLLGATAIGLTLVLSLFLQPLLKLLGAQGVVMNAAADYSRVIILGTVFQLLATGFTPLIRNLGAPVFAMAAMVCGFLSNIALDALFVWVLRLGMAGAAWATILGQVVTVVPCAVFLWKKSRGVGRGCFFPRAAFVKPLLHTGLSPFGLTMSPNLVLLLMNKSAIAYGGDSAVAAYAVAAYITCILQYLMQGVGDGSQPLFSVCLGTGDAHGAARVRRLAYGFSCAIGLVFVTVVLLLRNGIPVFFGASPAVSLLTAQALPICAGGALFVAFCRVTTSYFYSSRKNGFAACLVYGEPVLLTAMLLVLPRVWGLTGVWLAVPCAQALLALVGFAFLHREKRSAVPQPQGAL